MTCDLLSTQIIVAALIVAVALLALATYSFRNRFHDTVDRLSFQLAENQRLRNEMRATHEKWAADNDYNAKRLDVARQKMVEVRALVMRRPPRRRWLAMARSIAKIVETGV